MPPITSLVLHSPDDVYPGPYTYKRFWFRDAAFIIHALLCVGLTERAKRALSRFPERQTALGYFRSQEGEWDANGEVLWILQRYFALTGRPPTPEWRGPIAARRALDHAQTARVIIWMLPMPDCCRPGSAPSTWVPTITITGTISGASPVCVRRRQCSRSRMPTAAKYLRRPLKTLRRRWIAAWQAARNGSGDRPCRLRPIAAWMPAPSVHWRVGYPVQLCAPDDPRLLDCVEFLLSRCFVNGAFYQDMIHSGLNAYLTLHVAQVLLRAGDPRYLELMDAVAALASPTGQWPEAIHPRHRRRLHGRRPPCLGRCRVGADDAQLFRA